MRARFAIAIAGKTMSVARRCFRLALVAGCAWLAGCGQETPQVLGTLEFDRITLPAPLAERIVAIDVHEGDAVVAGQPLLQLDPTRSQADLAALQATAHRAQQALAEAEAGPRQETIAQARANLAAAAAGARQAQAYLARLLPLEGRNYVAAADLDRARAAAGDAGGRERAARAALDELLHGTRPEQVGQARAAMESARAQVAAQQALLDKLSVVAPRAGRVERLPYRLGDQAPVGAPLAILLAGDAPYARIYVPAPLRTRARVGDAVRVFVAGSATPLSGKVRMIRSEPVFTPYYALAGDDAARLSWLAEVTLGADARDLPAGVPVRVELAGAPP
jgi:HlyD family secretion protein